MAESARINTLSYADYLRASEASDTRLEFADGVIYAMAGGTAAHAYLGGRMTLLLGSALQGKPCRVYSSDLRIRHDDFAAYPDATVICGPRAHDEDDPHSATNPTLIVEVLSESTARWDRGGKFEHYQQIPSLQHVVFVDPERKSVEHYRRDGPRWTYTLARAQDPIFFDTLNVTLTPEKIFSGVDDA